MNPESECYLIETEIILSLPSICSVVLSLCHYQQVSVF